MVKTNQQSLDELEKVQIDLFLQGIYKWYGYDYRDYSYHSLKRRIWHRVQAEKLSSILELLDKVLQDQKCLAQLISDFSINVTEMFRNPSFFLQFREKVVPLLRTYPSIRIWHAGCATGEEVYSMAILLQEEGLYDKTKIYATDINDKVLKVAKNGQFPLEHMKKYTSNYLKAGGKMAFSEYYTVTGNTAQFHPTLTKNIIFAQHNLVTDQSFNEFHVILCRNVLIYFNKSLQHKVHDLFYESLSMFGVLGLGDKETISNKEKLKCYEAINSKEKLFQKVK
ncbi:chemotaxis protein methyltransferase CheR [Oceanobacillus limi]|uniref:Chemotaxis protein methyltransferase CheR n=1 Tax=Oceanobacillus limi TaxID=930131 RepID=A0A1I0BH93_9BACI|nr:protein-glutamate O-methyltransferase CheR [Oceanobacillus limi]SET06358.1 chemotaxis protein methyltransferase CheR [Oceanobacillus limi]